MSPSSSPSPERRPPPSRDQPSREQVNQAILGLGRSYVSTPDESTRLLGGYQPTDADLVAHEAYENPSKVRGAVWSVLTILVAVALVILLGAPQILPDALAPLVGRLPKDPLRAALYILDSAPVIDGHIDLPILLRSRFGNNLTAVDLTKEFVGHVDIPRLRQGKVGGFFWSVCAIGCANPEEEGEDFLRSTWRVRDTLEQIDVARLAIDQYSDAFQLALGSEDIKDAIGNGKIASLLGVEGGHQLGNSIAVLRQYHALGVRYVTLTHTCHNSFADSCGFAPGMIPLHGGLSPLGMRLIDEMNRLGVLVDLSHTSDDTARQALKHSKAPVIWSHSSARAVHDVPRNVPDDVLALVGTGEGQTDAVVMVNFAPFFVAPPGNATVYTVADHVEHIAKVAGKKHVGLGSDYDGIDSTPVGLEDVSKYPALIAELYTRGWTKYELAGLAGANLLRVFEGAEKVSQELRAAGTLPAFDVYPKRKDLPGW
ncbi:membrane dipeptidase-domain-containing protein [Mycena filopes]|nr:membrane dipeptidase-domain-containing protein [Mycena filopes]